MALTWTLFVRSWCTRNSAGSLQLGCVSSQPPDHVVCGFLRTGMSKLCNILFPVLSSPHRRHSCTRRKQRHKHFLLLALPVYAEDDTQCMWSFYSCICCTERCFLCRRWSSKGKTLMNTWDCPKISRLRHSHGFHLLASCCKNTAPSKRSFITFH